MGCQQRHCAVKRLSTFPSNTCGLLCTIVLAANTSFSKPHSTEIHRTVQSLCRTCHLCHPTATRQIYHNCVVECSTFNHLDYSSAFLCNQFCHFISILILTIVIVLARPGFITAFRLNNLQSEKFLKRQCRFCIYTASFNSVISTQLTASRRQISKKIKIRF